MERFQGLLGVVVLAAIAYALSVNRKRISARIVITGIIMQFALAWLLLSFPPIVTAFEWFAAAVTKVISFSDAGTQFIFGNLANS